MKLSALFAPTLKEVPKDAEVVSHRLLLRAGYIRKVAAGIYDYLPLGVRTLRRIEAIVREEMNRAGAQEVLMPAVQPAELWKESGRWDYYGPELLRFRDRKGGEFCLGPTHEEVITDLVRHDLRSYRQLPVNLYQIQTKFRDEIRPRAGLMRGREFIMKDAYSFDVDEDAARRSYQVMFDTYCRIFDRMGLRYRPVEADTGAIGGNLSHEFQVLADSGEDSIVSCQACGYTANIEKAELAARAEDGAETPPGTPVKVATPPGTPVKVATPKVFTVEQVASFFGVPPAQVIKSMVFLVDTRPVVVLVRGDHEAHEVKVKAAMGGDQVALASDAQVRELCGAPPGSVGPVGLPGGMPVLADPAVREIVAGICGANEAEHHLQGVHVARDVPGVQWADVRVAGAGDACGRCGGTFAFFRGIEVGQVFYLGTRYSRPLGATFLDAEGRENPMAMGCYGIGVSRILSAAIEQHHDDQGLMWPMSIAPFQVVLLPLAFGDAEVDAVTAELYRGLLEAGVEVLLDDRDQRPGFKFKDADLMGIPLRVVIGGRGLQRGIVEIKARTEAQMQEVPVSDAAAWVRRFVAESLATLRPPGGG
jgi:prolyl-tRNA synthetase